MKRPLILAAAAAFSLGGCAAMEGLIPGMAGMPADMTPEERSAYVRMAASSDLYEVQSSQLALARSQDPNVRQFAQMMVTDHTRTSQQLMAAATAAGVPPMSPQLMPLHAEMLSELQQRSGTDFTRLYLEQQVRAHEMAVALHSNYAQQGDAAALRAVAAAATPIVQRHLVHVRQMNR